MSKADGIDAQLFEDLDAQLYIKGCGGTARNIDGHYGKVGEHNGRNLYKKKGGEAHIYFDQIWRISRTDDLETFVYKNATELEAELLPENNWDAEDPSAMPEPTVVDEWLKRWEAMKVFQRLHYTKLPQHADTICKMLKDSKDMVRLSAITCLGRLHSDILEKYADTIIDFLAEEKKAPNREAAVKVLGQLHPEALNKHAERLVESFSDESNWVRLWAVLAIGRLESEDMRPYEDALVKVKVEDEYMPVREQAHQILVAQYERTDRAPHGGAPV
jgi:hypothetical protein|mmetsp:Transcript_12538/g.20662  ORF Transcript_12538/g.20662 Transcript_12538/m.20662 type:complete len:274 (+) Transcript_12538:68-889(+)